MQTATTMKRFIFNRAGGLAVALIIVTSGVIGVTALAIGDDASTELTVESARMMPDAFTSVGQGEGLIDGANLRVAAKAPHKAFTWDGQGEGLVDSTNRSVARAAIQAYPALGQGEGLVDPANRASEPDVLMAYPSPGQGEGLIGPGGLTE